MDVQFTVIYMCVHTDINECEAGGISCGENFVCVNNEGSYSCECEPDFFHDGNMCGMVRMNYFKQLTILLPLF